MNNQVDIKDVVKLLNKAVAHHQAGEKKEAEDKYNETLSFERAFKGLLASDGAETQESKTLLKTIFSQAYNNLGVFHEEEKNFGQAINSFRDALDHAPGNIEAHTNMARVFRKRRNLETALVSARAALKIKSIYVPAINELSKICYALGRPAEAIEAIQVVAPRLEKNARLNIEYGRLLEKSGDLVGAREKFIKALKLEPENFLANLSLGGVNFRLGKYNQAMENYQAILKTSPENILATANIGFILQRLGQYNEALGAYKAALSIDPGHLETLSLYGSLLEMIGKYEEGLKVSEQVLNTPKLEDRPFFTAHLTKAKCQRHLGQPMEEIATLKELLGGPIGASERSRIHYEFGLAHDALDQTAEAMRYFEKANTSYLTEAAVFEGNKNQLPEFIDGLLKSDLKPLVEVGYHITITGQKAPVFVVGFLMGGTEILSKYLSKVPSLQVLGDNSLIVGLRRGISREKEYPACLKDLVADEVRLWVGHYKKLTNQFAPGKAGRQTINTYPLDFLDLPVILKLFPKAKFIFVKMHPLDAVLNCYIRDLIPNPANINFSDLDDIAEIYASTMELWQKYKKELSFEYTEVQAEALLAKPEKEMKKILKFIDPDGTTGAAEILTKDLLQELSGEMFTMYPTGRWNNYKKYLKAVKKKLSPVIRKLGY